MASSSSTESPNPGSRSSQSRSNELSAAADRILDELEEIIALAKRALPRSRETISRLAAWRSARSIAKDQRTWRDNSPRLSERSEKRRQRCNLFRDLLQWDFCTTQKRNTQKHD